MAPAGADDSNERVDTGLIDLKIAFRNGRIVTAGEVEIRAEVQPGPLAFTVKDEDGEREVSDFRHLPGWAVNLLIEHLAVNSGVVDGSAYSTPLAWLAVLLELSLIHI